MNPKKPSSVRDNSAALYLLFVVLLSFFTYFYRYNEPKAVFWDEPYHIAAAEKYLSGVFFMEQHPPLGKLLIALGEKITNSNPKHDINITTDYARNFPEGFSFTGYRLFPTLLAWLTAPLLYFIFLLISGNPVFSALFSFLYIFDNAEIVHSRGAMVDSPLTFFGLVCALIFLHLQKKGTSNNKHIALSALFGIVFGLAMATKVVGLIFILLVPALLYLLYPKWDRMVTFCALSLGGFIIAFCGVWQIHFALGSRIVPELNNEGYYQASDEYKAILAAKQNGSLAAAPIMLRDSLKYITYYNKGVPRLDLCKPDENGSPSYMWPFGARSINYRWEKTADDRYRYLYLQSNPVAWGLGFIGVVLCGFFLLSRVLLPSERKLKHGHLMLTFFGMYSGYMIAISMLPRVMYLYHYFIPLLFSFILFALAVENLEFIGKLKLTTNRKLIGLTMLGVLIFGAYQYYRPLSYYEPIADEAFQRRAIVPMWELHCVRCEKVSGIAVPVERNPQ